MNFNLYPILRFMFSPLFKLLYRPTIVGKENIPDNGSLVIVCNHKHAMDPIMIALTTKRTIHYLAKKEIFIGPLKYFFKAVGTLPVDRGNRSGNEGIINEAENMLNNGGIIGLFPEGTRNKSKEFLLPLKKGCIHFAKNTNSKILPIYIDGKYKFFRKSLVVKVGKPYKVKKDIDEELDILKNKFYELKEGSK